MPRSELLESERSREPGVVHGLSDAWRPSTAVRLLRTILGWAAAALRSFNRHENNVRAAALGYQLLLSLFPLLLFLVSAGSSLWNSADAQASLEAFVERAFPGRLDVLRELMGPILAARGPMTLVSGSLLVWSASAIFTTLSNAMNVIWGAEPRPFWRRRLIAVVAVLGVGLMFAMSLALSASALWLRLRDALPWAGWIHYVVDWFVGLFVCLLLFRWLPNRTIPWLPALAGGALSATLWLAAKDAFRWYLTSGVTNLGLVYGSLASIVALLLWTYLSGVILFLGAEWGATVERELGAG
jgi:membrane protein